MVVKLLQLSFPFTAFLFLRTVDFESIERLLKPFVGKIIEIFCITARARLEVTFDPLNTQSTEALSTAGYLVRLSKDMEANGTLSWKPLWRIFIEEIRIQIR